MGHMNHRIAGSDFCSQCRTEFRWLQVTANHRERLFCDCQWAARLKQVDPADLEELRAMGDEIARRELLRRMRTDRVA
jgi:hypothetical protein